MSTPPPGNSEPLPIARTVLALTRCVLATIGLLLRRHVRLPADNLGLRLGFADGTSARVFRETIVEGSPARQPCVLVVKFELRGVRARGHALFRRESLFNTILFAGFPGLLTKLWVADDEHGVYRGLYEWDGAADAEAYARALWRVLSLVSVPGSIGYRVLPGLSRADLFAAAEHDPVGRTVTDWWRVTSTHRT
ncbi:hypothetical protein [Nocardia sp. NPDC003345]